MGLEENQYFSPKINNCLEGIDENSICGTLDALAASTYRCTPPAAMLPWYHIWSFLLMIIDIPVMRQINTNELISVNIQPVSR
jgi:hypothetical protein